MSKTTTDRPASYSLNLCDRTLEVEERRAATTRLNTSPRDSMCGRDTILAMDSDAPMDTAAAIQVAALREALRAFLRGSEVIARKNGLTPQRHLLLLMIKGAPDGSERSTVTQLAARLRLAQTTVTDLVRRAEDAGLLAREQSGVDARVTILRLTEEGERRLRRSFQAHDPERKQLLAALKRLNAS